jgi:hypothetical protein
MAARKSFALRIDSKTYAAMQRWAKDDLRSLNAQIEYVLRDALRKSGRLNGPEEIAPDGPGEPDRNI